MVGDVDVVNTLYAAVDNWRSGDQKLSLSDYLTLAGFSVTQSGGVVTVSAVSITPNVITVAASAPFTVTATVLPLNASYKNLVWTGTITAGSVSSDTLTASYTAPAQSGTYYVTATEQTTGKTVSAVVLVV
jgi:hypothetical protein